MLEDVRHGIQSLENGLGAVVCREIPIHKSDTYLPLRIADKGGSCLLASTLKTPDLVDSHRHLAGRDGGGPS